MTTPLDTSIEATYADGFVLSETELNDVSPYNPTHNVFRAVLDKEPEAEHGKLVIFSVFYKNNRYDIDFTTLPDNARPVRFRHGAHHINDAGEEWSEWTGMQIGYQYNDETGKNIKEIKEL